VSALVELDQYERVERFFRPLLFGFPHGLSMSADARRLTIDRSRYIVK